ncbi:MAG: PAS domain S-box protein [Desulfomonilaceae bacterium]
MNQDKLLAEIDGLRRRVAELEDIRVRLMDTERALRESELKHRTLFETASDAILLMHHDRFIDCNSRTLTIFGCSREEIVGAPPYEFSPPTQPDGGSSEDKALEKINLALTEGPQLFEWEHCWRDGTPFMAEVSLNRLDLDGETLLQAIVRDVTDRKKGEEKLVESERKYRELVEHANSIILRWTRDGKITFLNEFGQKFFGYSSEEILGRHVVGTIVPRTDSSGRDLGSLMDQILADPKTFEQNVNENMRRSGERVGIAWTNKIVPDEQGQVAEVLSIGTDITELQRAQEEINERNEEVLSINRIVSAVTGFLDLRGVLEQVLDEALELVGLEGGAVCLVAPNETLELTANRAASGATIRDWTTNSVRVGDCLCGECARTLEPLIFRNSDEVLAYATRESTPGEPIHFHAAFPLVTAGRCVGVLCVFTRTERKPSEQRLKLLETVTGQLALAIDNAQLYEASRSHAVELERIVAERTRELAHAKERAEAADYIKSAFLATMSHELRTPLNSIIGFTGIILQGLAGPLNQEQSKQLEMVRSSSRHLLTLINDVLDISKIEAGQLEVANERFDLRSSINKVVGIVAPLAEKKGLALRADIAPEVDEAVGDSRRVEQILLNLLNNAIKFTDLGGVALEVQSIPDFKSAGRIFGQPAVRLSVSDTGIGIKPDDLATLFQPFRQIESGLSRNYEGTGLGLAICRRLADLMGGEISAESTWEKGSTFSFTLPLKGSSRS